jgi:hypothetical protein
LFAISLSPQYEVVFNEENTAMATEAQKENPADGSATTESAAVAADQATKARREFSTIVFSYVPLDTAEKAVRALFDAAGMSEVTLAQAAAAMTSTVTSSGFRGDIGGMKLFGLIEGDQGRVRVTELGRSISEDSTAEAARVQAFERIPLYQRVIANHSGKTLPRSQALEKEFIQYGVNPKQVDRARQVFDRSAKHAGFIKSGSDRFSAPILHNRPEKKLADAHPSGRLSSNDAVLTSHKDSGGGGGNGGDLHPFIAGLLKTLPAPETEWKTADRVKWLQTAASIFGLIYLGDGAISVSVSQHDPTASKQPA